MAEILQAELTVNELHNILANTIIFAAREKLPASLQAVKLSAHSGELKATATDRYQIAQALGEADFVDPRFNCLIPSDQVKLLITALKKFPKKYAGTSLVYIYQNEFELRVQIAPADNYDGDDVKLVLAYNDFPKLETFFNHLSTDPTGTFALQPEHLANIAKVKRIDGTDKKSPTQIIGGFDGTKPVTFRRGDWFRGVVMPVRVEFLDALGGDRFLQPAPMSERAQALVA